MAKKEQKSVVPLILGAVGLGIVAAVMAMLYLNAREGQLKALYEKQKTGSVTVVVANKNLVKGMEITMADFSARPVPTEFVHDDAISPNNFNSYIGRSIIANLGQGKTLLKSFVDDDFPRDFSDIIPPGKRAITITVDDINSIGGFLRPGNRIDIYVNIPFSVSGFQPALFSAAKDAGLLELLPKSILSEIPAELIQVASSIEDPTALLGALTPSDVIIPVLQNVTVLATGKDPYRETLDALRQPQRRTEAQFSNITLQVDAEQAALITLAEENGEIVTLLRNRNDKGASSFTNVSPLDLFGNAAEMASAEKERASRVTAAAGVDVNGNLVDADGNKLMSSEQLAAAGYSVNENGDIVDKDGNIVDPNDLMIAADGSVINKQQLAAAGLTVNESGQIIDKDGNVVDANNIVIAADGTVMTKEQLAAAGLSVNANGEIVDKDGKIVSINDIVVSKDGTVLTKDQLTAAGLSLNENGEIVDKDGNIVNPEDLNIAADGSVLSASQLAAAGLSINENGDIVDKDGNIVDPDSIVVASDGSVMTKEQLAAAGLSLNENGEIVDANGNVVDKNDLIVSANGEVLSKQQLAAAGLSVNADGEIVDAKGNLISAKAISEFADNQSIAGKVIDPGNYDLIIGG
ncbi:MAG: pilus assembly protein CpaB, partial [Gammaproteobacteria bacterium]